MTSHALKTVAAIHADAKARREEFAGRGIRDIITVMTWPSGMVEVSGFFNRGRYGKITRLSKHGRRPSLAPASFARLARETSKDARPQPTK